MVAAGVQASFIVRLRFVATTSLAISTFEGKGCGDWAIELGAQVVTFLIMRLI